MSRKNIALLAGGFTGEYEVSINSARNIKANLDASKYDVYTILINRDRWFYEAEGGKVDVDKNDFSLTLKGEKIRFDFAFITVHGTPARTANCRVILICWISHTIPATPLPRPLP